MSMESGGPDKGGQLEKEEIVLSPGRLASRERAKAIQDKDAATMASTEILQSDLEDGEDYFLSYVEKEKSYKPELRRVILENQPKVLEFLKREALAVREFKRVPEYKDAWRRFMEEFSLDEQKNRDAIGFAVYLVVAICKTTGLEHLKNYSPGVSW